jgi:hypothetical protein
LKDRKGVLVMADFSFNPETVDYTPSFSGISQAFQGIPNEIEQGRQTGSNIFSLFSGIKQDASGIPGQITQESNISSANINQIIIDAGKASGEDMRKNWKPEVTPLDHMIAQNTTAGMFRLS